MNTSNTCPKCGTQLQTKTIRGLCPKCLALLAMETSSDETTVISPSSSEPPRATLNPTVRYFGDYELLDEIARGGMGVVFKARQTGLNRIVAVKMILSGQLAGEAEVKRFYTEAEAAANLQHPNIVAIHEVGEHEGRHYFSMDYIEGENLAAYLKRNPLSATEAARLMKTIAEAIHFAHQRGTLHRDLKPHNILIDQNGVPHITDFGLAKKIETDSGITQSGTVMGSPAYMPPEQAAGKNEQVGPASDVYSLGAILYQILTGQPPFSGATSVETLVKVMQQEPIAPSRLSDKVPTDLETICLKCLEKRPERRYHSARELAEDLGRFLNEQPIFAKPASAGRKTWNWLVRNPWALTGAAAMLVLGLMGLAYGLWEQNQAMKWSAAHGKPSSAARVPTPFTVRDGWWVAALVFNGVLLAPFGFADFVDRKRRKLPILSFHLRLYTVLALVQIVIALACARHSIHRFVWDGYDGNLFMTLLTVVSPIWFGALLLWHVAAQIRASTFGIEQKNERELFAPKKDYWTVEQYQFTNISLFAVAGLFVAGAILKSQILPSSATMAGIATVLLAGYRGEKTANRSLRLFLGIVLALAVIMTSVGMYRSNIYSGFSPFDRIARQWSGSIGAVFGVICGWILIRWQARGKTHTPCEAHRRAWPRYHKVAGTIVILQPFLLVWVLGTSAVLASFPFLIVLWRNAQGAEKRAMTTSIVAAPLLIGSFLFFIVVNGDNIPRWWWLATLVIALGIGSLVALGIHVAERRAVTRVG